MNIEKWEKGKVLSPEEEGEYLADVCEYLRNQQVLSEPKPNENGGLECEVVPDEVAAHVADLLEELWCRVQNLTYELREKS